MVKVTKKLVLAALPTLTKVELEEVQKRCKALLGLAGNGNSTENQVTPPAMERDWLWNGIISELNRAGFNLRGYSLKRAYESKEYAAYREASAELRVYLEECTPGMSVVEREALGRTVAQSLARYLKPWAEVSLRSMCYNVGKIPEALNRSFPGYLASGMLRHVVRVRSEGQ